MNAPAQHPPAVRTTCPYCGVGCGVLAKPDSRGGAVIAGDPEHPANFGRLCSKGSALGETLGLGTRLLHPMMRDNGVMVRADWNQALDAVAAGFAKTIVQHGPDSVAFYLSGQLLTEDYYVANKLMKGFIGSGNVDTNSRLCMASSVAGHRRAFGADTVPGTYADLDSADLIILVGSNAAWCHPVLYQRMIANKRERGAKLIVIDPRRTATAEEADLFLPVAPGMDTALFCGLLVHLADTLAMDYEYIDAHTTGLPEALARAREIAPDVMATANATGLAPADVVQFFALFTATAKTVTCFSQGVNQSAQGTDKVTTIINCHLATGRIGKPGAGPFSLTGQPNAMGGREVGGLANQLAAHMNFTPGDIDRVGRFWRASNMAQREGLKAVQMFDAIDRGEIKALWVMATNPAVSLPRAGSVRDALGKLDLLVISDNVASNDTITANAHILLPATAWGEKDGTVTNSERRISRQRPFLAMPGEAKPDWWIVTQVARRMGHAEAFNFASTADIFREHAELSAFENDGARDFDIGGLAALDEDEFNALDPVQWPARAGAPRSDLKFSGDMVMASPTNRVTNTPVAGSVKSTSGLTQARAASVAAWASLVRLMYSSVPLPGSRNTQCSPPWLTAKTRLVRPPSRRMLTAPASRSRNSGILASAERALSIDGSFMISPSDVPFSHRRDSAGRAAPAGTRAARCPRTRRRPRRRCWRAPQARCAGASGEARTASGSHRGSPAAGVRARIRSRSYADRTGDRRR